MTEKKEILENLEKLLETLKNEPKKPRTVEESMEEISESLKEINEKLSKLLKKEADDKIRDFTKTGIFPNKDINPIKTPFFPYRELPQYPNPYPIIPYIDPFIITCNVPKYTFKQN